MRLRLAVTLSSLVAVAACGGDPIIPVDATPDADMTDAEDVDPPDTTIDDGPDNLTNDDEAVFTFHSDESATFLCRLDSGSQSPCTSPKTLSNLSDGQHTFEVVAVDTSRLQDPTPAIYMWKIDTEDPDTEITEAPPPIDNSTSATISFRAPSEIDPTFECSLDGSVFATCTSPYMAMNLTDGNHVFRVRAIDQAGNADTTTANANWVVDTISPDTIIDSGPANTVNSRSATFTFSSPGFMPGWTFACRLDTAPFTSCTSPRQFSGLLDGQHAFEVRVTDELGNPDPSPARRVWTIDSTGPITSITMRPNNPSGDTTPTFEFTANEAMSTFECQIDGLIPYAPCQSPSTTAPLPAGIRFFRIRATDPVGNVGPEATYEWVIDASGPTVSITSGPNGPVGSSTVTFNWNSSEPATYCYRFTGDAMDTCTMNIAGSGTVTRPGLMQGDQTFTITATDALGNVGAPTVRNFSVDTVGPPVTITAGPMNTVGTVANQFTFSSTEPATFCHKVDTLGEVCTVTPALTSSVTINAIDGAHQLTVVARDALGNRTAMPVVRMWTIDTVRPTTTITAGPDQGSFDDDGAAQVMLGSSEASTICWRINGGNETCSAAGQMMFTADLMGMMDGVINFSARSQDAIGFGPVVTRSWTVDSIRPTVMIGAGPLDGSTVGSMSATFVVTASEASRICWVFNTDDEVCSPPGVTTFNASKAGLPQGMNTIAVHAEDAIGDGPVVMRSWTVDTVRPILTINTGPAQGSTINDAVSMLQVNSSESSQICWRFNGGAETCSAMGVMMVDITSPAMADGGVQFEVYGKDAVGTGAVVTRTWTVDSARPVMTITAGPAQNSFQGSGTVSFTVASSERATICWKFNNNAQVCTAPGQLTAVASTTGLPEGPTTFSVTGADAVGAGNATMRDWTIDLTRPTMSFSAGPAQNARIDATSAMLTAAATEPSTICWRLDGGAETCSAAGQMMLDIMLAMLGQGGHAVTVYGRDGVGNGPTVTRNFVVDTIRPTTSFTSGPAEGSTVNSGTVSFGLASSEAAQICYKFNMAAEVCSMQTNITSTTAMAMGLGEGMNTIAVRSLDSAGTGATVMRTFIVDTMAPTVMITAGPAQGSVQASANLSFTVQASEAALVCWRFNAAPQPTCAPTGMMNQVTFISGPLPAGNNVMAVWAIDGNGPGPTLLRTWSNDTARPTITITAGPTQNELVDSANVMFTLTASEPCKICWQFDGGAATCTGLNATMAVASANGLAEGNHAFTVNGEDAVGVGTTVTRNWKIDTISPVVTISSPPVQNGFTNQVNQMFTIMSDEPANICSKIDMGAFTCTGANQLMQNVSLMNLAAGMHTLTVTATDNIAHTTNASRTWTIDTTFPTLMFTSGPAEGGTSNPNPSFGVSSTEAVKFCQKLDGGAETCGAPGAMTTTIDLMGLSAGAHTLIVTGEDPATNKTTIMRSWMVMGGGKPGIPGMPGAVNPAQSYNSMVSAWVRDAGQSNGQILVMTASQGGCTLRGVGALLGLECQRGGEVLTGAYGVLDAAAKSDGGWHLVTVAFTDGVAELWIDGAFADRTGEGIDKVTAGGVFVQKGAGSYGVESVRVR